MIERNRGLVKGDPRGWTESLDAVGSAFAEGADSLALRRDDERLRGSREHLVKIGLGATPINNASSFALVLLIAARAPPWDDRAWRDVAHV
jgi:hypothetical protein